MRAPLSMLALAAMLSPAAAGTVGLGAALTTADGGEIQGFDIDRDGNDGVLASARTIDDNGDVQVSMEVFDQDTGKIVKSFAKYKGPRNQYSVDGIFAGDVALVKHYVTPKGSIFAKRLYETMNPVTGHKFTGAWTPPLKDIDIQQVGVDQDTSTATVFAIELKKGDKPLLLVSDVAAGTFSGAIHLSQSIFGLGNAPVLGQYTSANKAVFALSPDGGAVGGKAPLNILIDLSNGSTEQFLGYNNGEFHAGYVNGMAVDPNTGIAATTTELNAQVEFYDMGAKKRLGFTQLPCTGDTDQSNSGAGIAVDAVNKLFLVADPFYCDGSQGGAIVIYDEQGNLVNTITGFDFAIAEPAPAINPSKRMGWTFSGEKGLNRLRQFFY